MMVYKTQAEVEADIKDGVLVVDEEVKFECSISIDASLNIRGNINAEDINARDIDAGNINALNISARDIDARDIDAGNINARDINAEDINARDIDAGNINALNISARDIDARDIDAGNINARNINGGNISFYAVAFACISFKCKSIVGRRHKNKYFCLDGEVEITG